MATANTKTIFYPNFHMASPYFLLVRIIAILINTGVILYSLIKVPQTASGTQKVAATAEFIVNLQTLLEKAVLHHACAT